MALTNQSKQAGIKASKMLSLDDLVRALRAEVKQAGPLNPESKSEYIRRAAQLNSGGWDIYKAGKRERYMMRAAGVWDMRIKIREKLTEADRIVKSGEGSRAKREADRGVVLAEALQISNKLDDFRDLPWTDIDWDAKQQARHKKRSATDEELERFFEAVGGSRFRDAFLVAEFTGLRGAELGNGVRIKAHLMNNKPALTFFIESAKCDGKRKGLDLREIVVPFPSDASAAVQKRWSELARRVASAKDSQMIVTVAKTEKQTAGQRFTQNFRHFAKAAGLVDFSAYSLRHRVSAQAKETGGAENTALVLGHQTTETQRHYGRSKRGRGGISPVAHVGVNASGIAIRGNQTRQGPSSWSKEKTALKKVLSSRKAAASVKRPRL